MVLDTFLSALVFQLLIWIKCVGKDKVVADLLVVIFLIVIFTLFLACNTSKWYVIRRDWNCISINDVL